MTDSVAMRQKEERMTPPMPQSFRQTLAELELLSHGSTKGYE